MEINHVCPQAKEPVKSPIIGNGTMTKNVWEAKESGPSGEESKSWKTIIVACSFCGKNHEYALTMHP
ncbi:MAG: hypothetical protein WCK37_04115 [Candidatus Falkowbacteria bacterium]